MEKFDNFGQALAWMMESPENVAVCKESPQLTYRFSGKRLQFSVCGHNDTWVRADEFHNYCHNTWSRAPREPLEFRWNAVVGRSWANSLSIAGGSSYDAIKIALRDIPEGTEFELILKEKN